MMVVVLGAGASGGIPVPYCRCRSCEEARRIKVARRKPTSVLIVFGENKCILVDAGFDVSEHVDPLDLRAVLITHWHHDHFAGLYRLRWTPRKIPLYSPKITDSEIASNPLRLDPHILKAFDTVTIDEIKVTALPLEHPVETYGYLIESKSSSIAVLFDTKGLPSATLEFLRKKKVALALIDANFPPGASYEGHNNVDEALEIGREIGVNLTVLTHISHENLPFSELRRYVAEKTSRATVAYDGMTITLP